MKLQEPKLSDSHKYNMSFFSTELEAIRTEIGLTQTQMAERAGILGPSMSRYMNGSMADEDALIALCEAMPTYSDRLVAAWTQDRIPPALRELVQVLPGSGRKLASFSKSKSPPWQSLPPRARKLLEEAALCIQDDPRFAQALQSILRLQK